MIGIIDGTLAGGASRDVEGRIWRRDGSSVVLLWNVGPLWDAEGRCAGIVGVGFDITRRRQAERRVRASDDATVAAPVGGCYQIWRFGRPCRSTL